MKKFVSGLLAMVMSLGLSVAAFAADTNDQSMWHSTVDPVGTYKASDGGTLIIANGYNYIFNIEGAVYKDVDNSVPEANPIHYMSADGSVSFPYNQYRKVYDFTSGDSGTGLVGRGTGLIDVVTGDCYSKGLLWDGKDTFYAVTLQSQRTEPSGQEGMDNTRYYYYNLQKAYKKVSSQTGSSSSSSTTFKSDTGAKLTVVHGKTYQFKITSLNGKKPTFVSGNSSVFQVKYKGNKGSNYYFAIQAVGRKGQAAGIYIDGSKAPNTVGTIG